VSRMIGLLLILGTACCVSIHDTDRRVSDEVGGSTVPGDIREQQHEDTCLMSPEYCRR
jgi:hypothetical protein